MKLLTQEIRQRIPKLYETEKVPEDQKKIVVKFFTPWNKWTWYAVEGQPVFEDTGNGKIEEVDFEFFGYVDGDCGEWGYWTVNQLEEVKGPFGLRIERDLHFKNKVIGNIKNN